jgi:hypothetical protein
MSDSLPDAAELRALDLLMKLVALGCDDDDGNRCRWCLNATGWHGAHRSNCPYDAARRLLDSPDGPADDASHIVAIPAADDGTYPALAIVSRLLLSPFALQRLRDGLNRAMQDGTRLGKPFILEAHGLELYQLVDGRWRPLSRSPARLLEEGEPCDRQTGSSGLPTDASHSSPS